MVTIWVWVVTIRVKAVDLKGYLSCSVGEVSVLLLIKVLTYLRSSSPHSTLSAATLVSEVGSQKMVEKMIKEELKQMEDALQQDKEQGSRGDGTSAFRPSKLRMGESGGRGRVKSTDPVAQCAEEKLKSQFLAMMWILMMPTKTAI
ncbi:hypothetical protein DPEC_G00071760 [Dallia pectoralis]|uniref:Uncharacterized protein n=1 Tax=Dallia pectoralis TaxID=75939 RepID=A0ACC2H2J1_DALPE|nr:hypothetical protein DPEC_G00071760 [Dallia pectoralis]